MRASIVQPALFGGLVMGVLSALPIISAGNMCCCLWVVIGGAVAAYLLQQNQSTPITPGDGALVGLLAGLFGAVVHLIVSIPIGVLMAPMERAMMQRVAEIAPPEMRSFIDQYANQDSISVAAIILRRMVGFIFMVFVGGVFSTIGGLLGAVIFRKPQPPGVIDIPPSS